MDGFREGFRVATVVRFSLGGQCAKESLPAPFCTPCRMPFWPTLDPPRVPFWKFLLFGGHPKIVILRTDSTLVGAENSTNPCINGASAPTFAFWEGSGNLCFFAPFSSRVKVAQEALEVSPGPKMDPHWVPIWEQNDVQMVVAQLARHRRLQTRQTPCQGLILKGTLTPSILVQAIEIEIAARSIAGADGCPFRVCLYICFLFIGASTLL